MLTPSTSDETNPPVRDPRRDKRLWHDEMRNTPGLGCQACPERDLCGGLRVKGTFFDCLQHCCGNKEECDRVCRNHADFPDRVREVNTFKLDTIPAGPLLTAPELPRAVPVVFHGNRRNSVLAAPVVALPLSQMLSRRTGTVRFADRRSLCATFRIPQEATVILTGTDRDPPLERWWEMGEVARRAAIRQLRELGVELATTPNYSLFIDRPRWDDLHAIKRIGTVHQEFLSEGLPAALHVNGRTDTDFLRWAEYLAAHSEITHVAYELTTGTSRRREQHAAWLTKLAAEIGRPLHLVVRGGTDVLPELAAGFSRVTILDTSIFMKTMKRQKASRRGNARMGWDPAPTPLGEPLDSLMAENRDAVLSWLTDLATPARLRTQGPA